MSADTQAPIDPELLRRARRRVGMRIGFLTHFLVFVVVNGGLVILNVTQGAKPLWSFWPVVGWGIGLAAHGLATWFSLNGDGMRSRMLKQEIDRLRRS
ncbi:MAG: 2TM domain-containing protein [Phenylobacterium sp.]